MYPNMVIADINIYLCIVGIVSFLVPCLCTFKGIVVHTLVRSYSS